MGRFAHDLSEEGLALEEFDVLVHLAWAKEGQLPLRQLVASCGFRSNPITRFAPIRSVVSEVSDHPPVRPSAR